ncbi:hypothetical protein [Burkholderia sp. NLJ2]|uniref:hypothetical protein n=1 Tax=Burkholderia sp. NLJ2 TaxID=3090699 RepID=UPI003C6C61EC
MELKNAAIWSRQLALAVGLIARRNACGAVVAILDSCRLKDVTAAASPNWVVEVTRSSVCGPAKT